MIHETPRARIVAMLALLAACTERNVATTDGGASTSGDADSSSGGSTVTPSTTIDPSNVTTPGSSSEAGSDEGGCPGPACPSDIGELSCSTWDQDCPPGYKCSPFARDGVSWNDSHCVPVDPDAVGVGEECTVIGSALTGLDDCVFGAFCFDVDPRTGEGECYELCRGPESKPVCTDPASKCNVSSGGALNLCLPQCDPIEQDCGDGDGCYPVQQSFHCVVDAGMSAGAYGEACEFLNVCDPGLFCAGPERVPGCVDALGCCTEFCNLELGDPDASCDGAAEGQVCVPWFAEGEAPPALANVGACSLPE